MAKTNMQAAMLTMALDVTSAHDATSGATTHIAKA